MKAIFLLFTILVTGYLPASKPKFKYIRTGTQLYISVKGLAPDSSDAVLYFMKDTLQKIKFDLITKNKYNEIARLNLDLLKEEMKNVTYMISNGAIDTKGIKDRFRTIAGGTPVQSLTIQYTSITGPAIDFESCDSVGFTYKSLPPPPGDLQGKRVMWSVSEIKSRVPDSIALFILKKM